MATTFPTTIDSYTTKVNNVDTITASHVNDLQDAMVATETILGASSTRAISWTPTVAFSGGSTSMTYTSVGFYARFGSMIFLHGEFLFSAKGTSTGDLRVTNIPVASLSNAPCTITCSFYNNNWTTLQPIIARTGGSSSQIIDFYSLSGTTWTRVTDTHVQNTSGCRFSGFYFHA